MISDPKAPRFSGLTPASSRASAAARGASRKTGTRPELRLRRALWLAGARYRVDVAALPGRPDIVFPRAKLAVFVDGDFWHGKNLDDRLARLGSGHNAAYWVRKVETNVARDRRVDGELVAREWRVLRVWETDVTRDEAAVVQRVLAALAENDGRSRGSAYANASARPRAP